MEQENVNKLQLITEELKEQIRKMYTTEDWTHKRLADRFGQSVHQIKKILNGVIKWRQSVEKRFWEKVDDSGGDNACWEWQGTRDRNGYGRFYLDGKKEKAHRIAYRLTYGEIPEGLVVRHKVCRNRACCNPKHLLMGTDEENQLDKMEDGTNWRKLSNVKVLEAKYLREIGLSLLEIANYLGVSPKNISAQLKKLKDEETQLTYQRRGKEIYDKEVTKNNPPIQIVIDRVID